MTTQKSDRTTLGAKGAKQRERSRDGDGGKMTFKKKHREIKKEKDQSKPEMKRRGKV